MLQAASMQTLDVCLNFGRSSIAFLVAQWRLDWTRCVSAVSSSREQKSHMQVCAAGGHCPLQVVDSEQVQYQSRSCCFIMLVAVFGRYESEFIPVF